MVNITKKKFVALKKSIPINFLRKGSQPLKMPVQLRIVKNVIDEPYHLIHSIILEFSSQEDVNKDFNQHKPFAIALKYDIDEQLERISNENTRLKMREE